MWQLFLFLFLDFQVLVHSLPFNNSSSTSPVKLCSPEEMFALINFKNSLFVFDSFCEKINSWKENRDCCSWDGVTCDTFTGHVIGLDLSSSCIGGIIDDNSTLFLLHHLQRLNLAFNYFLGSNISGKFGQFKELTHLNVSSSSFSGLVPPKLSHLSNLVSLDLSSPDPFRLKLSQDSFNKIAHNLNKLRYLHLNWVDMSSIAVASLVNLSSSLISLSLAKTDLQGRLPTDIFYLPFLQRISLSYNDLLTGNLPKSNWSGPLRFLDLFRTSSFSSELPDTIGNLKYLKVLDLGYSNFRGSIPTSLGNLTEIISLDLTSNNFTGGIPSSISNLLEITSLNLRDNKFSGPFPEVFGNLSKLTDLSLSSNTFSGHIPSSAFNLTQIPILDFSMNSFEGQIPPSEVSGLSNLIELDLSYNLLSGEIPLWLFSLRSLESLSLNNNKFTGPIQDIMFLNFNLTKFDLSSNNLHGILKSNMLAKLKNLEIVDLSHNKLLSLTPNSNTNFTLPKLRQFRFSFCSLNEFPKFLRNAKNLELLDLSNNKLSGKISLWEFGVWTFFNHLNLSQNFLTSFELTPRIQPNVLDLHSNLLQGPLLNLPRDIVFFSASNNKLTGEIPSSFCSLTTIEYLILSNNSLSGTIPHCLGSSSLDLRFLDLRMNNFQGRIPQTLAVRSIRYLNLNGNGLVGQLPPSFVNCSELEVLDVGNNKINDTFPLWLASLPALQVLILRANGFHGPIGNPNTRYPFAKLRVLDLSHNQFDGLLPTRYFANFESMMHGPYGNDRATYMQGTQNPHPYDKRMATAFLTGSSARTIPSQPCCDVIQKEEQKVWFVVIGVPYYSMVLTMKGSNMKVERILMSLTAIDFSNNLFEGGIPRVLGNLISLKMLNFSQNKLNGEIPSSLANLTELESLDLSSNKLTGEIPIQLTNLTFLAVLNLSYNQLRGRIPQGNQFGTFQNDSFIGNLGLCGAPLSQECGNKKAQEPSRPTMFFEEDDSLSWLDWKVTMMGYASGLVIGFSLGYIVFVTRKPQWFVRRVERQLQTKMRRLGRRC